jgi:hypothetical protein
VPQRERRKARQLERAPPGQEQAGAGGRARSGPRGGAIA